MAGTPLTPTGIYRRKSRRCPARVNGPGWLRERVNRSAVQASWGYRFDALGVRPMTANVWPHLYLRTLEFAEEFGTALASADHVVVLDVYVAREDPIPGVDGRLIATAVPVPADRVHYVFERSEVPSVLAGLARSGDVVITMGAGDITALGSKLLNQFARKGQSS